MACISCIRKRKTERKNRGILEWNCLLVECYVGGQIFGDGVQLTGRVSEVFVSPFAEFPVFRLVVPYAPKTRTRTFYTAAATTGRANGSTETRLTSELALGQTSCSQRKLEAWSDVLLACFQELL